MSLFGRVRKLGIAPCEEDDLRDWVTLRSRLLILIYNTRMMWSRGNQQAQHLSSNCKYIWGFPCCSVSHVCLLRVLSTSCTVWTKYSIIVNRGLSGLEDYLTSKLGGATNKVWPIWTLGWFPAVPVWVRCWRSPCIRPSLCWGLWIYKGQSIVPVTPSFQMKDTWCLATSRHCPCYWRGQCPPPPPATTTLLHLRLTFDPEF